MPTMHTLKKGDYLGNVGNSGNTSAPHLHLHLMHSMSPVGSSPVVYLYDYFTLVGQIGVDRFYQAETLEGSFGNGATFIPKICHKQFPMDLNILEF
jgi:murein DD-endopeptidase MepM/ murein hydrolase activator NlpD